jgi:hypothetical protein
MTLSKSAKYYRSNSKARKAKQNYDTKYHGTAKRRAYRSDLNKENRRRGTYGNGDGKDVSHTRKGTTVLESQSKNRARQGAGGKRKRK